MDFIFVKLSFTLFDFTKIELVVYIYISVELEGGLGCSCFLLVFL